MTATHRSPTRRLWPLLPGLALIAAGCVAAKRPAAPGDATAEIPLPLFAAADALMKSWRHVQVWGESEWRLVPEGDGIAIEPRVEGSSSALVRYIDIDTAICPVVEWTWRVDRLPEGADLASRESEDVAASLFFVFGDPGALSNPKPVPTLRYAWTAAANPAGSIVDSPYFPGTLRSIAVRSGPEGLGIWRTERRNLRDDYRAAFGEAPPGPVQLIALYTDNDHLEQPVQGFYRSARALCTEDPASFWPS